MIRHILTTTALFSIVGCSASSEIHGLSSSSDENPAQLAAYAATATAPGNVQARNDLRAAAVVSKDNGTIRIYNFTDKPLTNGNVWINGTYVQKFDSIPAKGYTTLNRSNFYDKAGTALSGVNSPADSVQIQWNNEVYTLLGPVYQ